ncbi:Uncharacterised protein [Corynebacterium minutissimum]|uniref:Uncharacterized protein n=1 Tax=Corynebacterium minutissimum TaxID=38301 RepID=A0A376CWY8_9CORY|nr:Uncharacterised protein [Corynebacterium minutissimum]
MGVRGPMPKRAEDVKGHRTKAELKARRNTTPQPHITTDAPIKRTTKQPRAATGWSESAKLMWKALGQSRHTAHWPATDWATARQLMADVSQFQRALPNAQVLATIGAGIDDLLMTEGARRRAGAQLPAYNEPPKPPKGSPDWDPDCRALWRATRDTPDITRYYEPTDWAVLHFVLTETTRMHIAAMKAGKTSGALMQAIHSIRSNLMLTEGTRRRLDLSLEVIIAKAQGDTPGEKFAEQCLAMLKPQK